MLLLFAVYGMRSGEVRTLKLEDLDWGKNLIWVPRTKGRRIQCYPLAETVGEAILRYLEDGRPKSSKYREVFLTVEAPIQPLRGSSPGPLLPNDSGRWDFLSDSMARTSFATLALLACWRKGFSLKEIGDHLGHRAPKVTAAYAKVDIDGLRQVANLILGGLV